MQHIRIATYQQTTGTFDDLCLTISPAPGGLADAFRASPGFVAYTFADLGDGTNCSISVWTSGEAADAAMAAARTYRQPRTSPPGAPAGDRTGRLGFVVGRLGAVRL